MYQKSAGLFISAGYIVTKTRSLLEANTVNMLVCLRRHLSGKTHVLFTVFN